MSGLGKGVTVSSIGKLLQTRGFKVTAIKIDPYLNYDAGTLRPTEHGEVWVTEDGGEIDQDLGHYERFLDIKIPKDQNITAGQLFGAVIEKERQGKFLGKTVQPIPHITDEIKRRIIEVGNKNNTDFVLVEIGGTVGDYDNILFIEAIRQMRFGSNKTLFVHVTYVPVPKHIGEAKTKPTQHSVRALEEFGIHPDFLICRSDGELDKPRVDKITMFCNIEKEYVISNPDVDCVYEIPLIFDRQKVCEKILKKLEMKPRKNNIKDWDKFIKKVKGLKKTVKIGVIGKYYDIGTFQLSDSYISVIEAIRHAAWANNVKPEIHWVDSKKLEDKKKVDMLDTFNGIIVPGGFGSSGIEGKINAIEYSRKKKMPFLGLCLGLQLAVIEYARNVCGMKGAHSTEINDKTAYPVVEFLPKQRELVKNSRYGATMRLGGQKVKIIPNTLAHRLYGKTETIERFRHRYEINPKFVEKLCEQGFVFSGMTPDGKIMQIGELTEHPFFIGSQFHPEFTSRPLKPNPMFNGFIKACLNVKV